MPKWPFGDKGPVCVIWDYGGTELRIDPYLGTVTFRSEDQVSDVEEEGWGATIMDSVFAGTIVELEVPMVRNDLSTLNSLLPGTAISDSDYLKFSAKAGCDMYSSALAVVLKPMCDGQCDEDSTTWIHIFKCYPFRVFELAFDRDSQRILMVRFKVFPNQDSANFGELFEFGVDLT